MPRVFEESPVLCETLDFINETLDKINEGSLYPFGDYSSIRTYVVYCKSSESMDEVEDDSIHIVLTSPPYNAGIKYDVYNDYQSLEEYQGLMLRVFKECYKKLVIGGRIAIVIPTAMKVQNQLVFMPSLFERVLEESGFQIRALIVWLKPNRLVPRRTAWGTYSSPENPAMRSIAEFILVAHKGTPSLSGRDPDITPDEFKEYTINVWHIPYSKNSLHPAVFPEKLVRRILKLYSFQGQTVLDPFCGIGTTGRVCVELKRSFIGYDISRNYCRIARQRLNTLS